VKTRWLVVALICICLPLSALAQVKDDENTLKIKVAQAVRMLAAEGLVASSGHVSARIPGTNLVLMNSRDASREVVQPEDIVTIDLDGKKVAGKDREPDEAWIHLSVYRAPCTRRRSRSREKPMLPVWVHGAIFADGVPNRESWTPDSIAKRWEYYREKETRKVGNPSN